MATGGIRLGRSADKIVFAQGRAWGQTITTLPTPMSRRKKMRERTELVELTSKPLKLQSALSSILLLVGAVLLVSPASPLGVLFVAIGLTWKAITRIRIWWNHG